MITQNHVWIIISLQLLLFAERTAAMTTIHNRSILLTGGISSYCDMKCGDQPKHTLCEPAAAPSRDCPEFIYYDIKEYMDLIWHGHNGLRDRVAKKYNVANMKRLEWDMELAAMAKVWLMQCRKYQQDPCTKLPRDKQQSYTLVNQNVAFLDSRYLPENFYAMMMRLWYMEKWSMVPPTIDQANNAKFSRLNNYTQIIWAETWRIGCAAGSYSEGFALVCNYHGIKTANDVAWRIGDTCSKCPRNLPICDTYFQSLCTADKSGCVKASLILIEMTLAVSVLFADKTLPLRLYVFAATIPVLASMYWD